MRQLKMHQKRNDAFLSMLSGTLGFSLVEHWLAGKGVIGADDGFIQSVSWWWTYLIRPFTNFYLQKYYLNEPTVNGVYSKNSLSKIKDDNKSWCVEINRNSLGFYLC